MWKSSDIQPDAETVLYYYGARYYDPTTALWLGVDPMQHKYPEVSPYVYCAGNPVKYVDHDGREISVEEDSRGYFEKDLQNVFGDEKVKMFSYNENGKLQLNVTKKEFKEGLNRNQINVFKGLDKAMNDETETTIVYSNEYVDKNGTLHNVNDWQGGGFFNSETNEIVISPNVTEIEVGFPHNREKYTGVSAVIQQTTTTCMFHEIGERNTPADIKNRGLVIDYENHVRKVVGLPERPYDANHRYIH